MKWPHEDKPWTPSPELLAAYADGELDQAGPGTSLRQRLEEWLADHPEAAAEVEAQRRQARLWKSTAAPDPGEAAWSGVWARLQAAPREAGQRPSRGGPRQLAWSLAILLTAAASILLALLLVPRDNAVVPRGEAEEPFPVAAAEEVEIVSVDGADIDTLVVGRLPVDGPLPVAVAEEVEIMGVNGADTDALVVGRLPVHEPLVLAQPGDVSLVSVEPDEDFRGPAVHMGEQDTPMVWAPLETEVSK